jgi:glycerophosphoryl diester phosphodiesterase
MARRGAPGTISGGTLRITCTALLLITLFWLVGCAPPPAPEAQPVNATAATPLNIAHRGARSLAPENTIEAARLGLNLGADLWELDVTASADGVLVVIHDDTLERTSNAAEVYPNRGPWAVHTFTLEELRRLDFGSWFNQKDPFGQIAAGAVSLEMQQRYVGLPIPTLEESLLFTKENDWRVNVEIKDASGTPADSDLPEKVAALIHEMGMSERVLISSFNHDYLRRMKSAAPELPTAALVETPAGDPVGLARGLGAMGYNPGIRGLRLETIRPVREAGIEVYVWTVNDPDVMRALIRSGVSGIFTDFPQLLGPILEEK